MVPLMMRGPSLMLKKRVPGGSVRVRGRLRSKDRRRPGPSCGDPRDLGGERPGVRRLLGSKWLY